MESSIGAVRTVLVRQGDRSVDEVPASLDRSPFIEVLPTTSGKQALETLETSHVDCVVSEYHLDQTNGIALMDDIRQSGATIPFVLWPRKSNATLAARAVRSGVDRYRPQTAPETLEETLAETVMDAVEEHTPHTAILDRMTDAFLAVDDRWRITYLNDRCKEIISDVLGQDRSMEALRGRVLWEEVPSTADTRFQSECVEAMETQESRTFETYYETIDSWYEIRVFPSPTGLSLYFYDITDRREFASELERRERILREIHEIMAAKEMAFSEKVTELLEIGRAELDMTYGTLSEIDEERYTLEVVVGPSHETIQEGTTVDLSETYCERIVETGEHLAMGNGSEEQKELTDRYASTLGIERYLGTPIFVDNRVDGTLCLFDLEPREEPFTQWETTLVDVMGSWISYERQRAEQQAALEAERNHLEAVASTLSHDLRNPLTTATLRLELAGEECDSDHLSDVEEALSRIEELIDDTLTMARIGAQVMESEQLPLRELVTRAWTTGGSTDGTLQIEEIPETIVGDESRLLQLFENLFANAIEHAGPTVTVRVGELESTDGIFVADDGPGIPPDERSQIFDRGYSSETDGTGFGLAIVDRIVEAHDGAITVSESTDGGARFEIRGIELGE